MDSQTLRSLIDIATQYNNTMKSLGITNALNLESFIEGIIEYLEDKKVFLKTNEMFDIGRLDVGMAESLKRALDRIRETKAREKEIEEAAKAEAEAEAEAARKAKAARKAAEREQAAEKAAEKAAASERYAKESRRIQEERAREQEKRQEEAIAEELRSEGIESLDDVKIEDVIRYFSATAGRKDQEIVRTCRKLLLSRCKLDQGDIDLYISACNDEEKHGLIQIAKFEDSHYSESEKDQLAFLVKTAFSKGNTIQSV